jgi:hypothetical protein
MYPNHKNRKRDTREKILTIEPVARWTWARKGGGAMAVLQANRRAYLAKKGNVLQEADLDKIGGVYNANLLLELQHIRHPDLLILDWDLCCDTAAALMQKFRILLPYLKVIALGNFLGSRWEALADGVDEFVWKLDTPAKLYAITYKLLGVT